MSHPCRQQNRQNPNGSPGFPNGKPENHLRRRNRQHNNNISRSSKVQERTAGESDRRRIQGSDRKSGKMARPAKSGSSSGRTGNSSDSIRAKRVFGENVTCNQI